ncbi:MAG: hypothetical protein SWO11_23540 [Thermodesulfobacteriota bacterium]|nr:hypothetical protein [Thermodesulfobacteriota bacterium]
MIRIFFILILVCLIHTNSYAKQITLQWDQNNNNQIEIYRVYYGNKSGNYLWSKPVDKQTCYNSVCEFTVDLPNENWYFAATASDIYGRESDYSNEVYIDLSQSPTSFPYDGDVDYDGDIDQSPTSFPCDGDLDYDGDVDNDDLSIVVSEFGRKECGHLEQTCIGDIDYDGKVDLRDITILITEFGRTECP